MSADVMERERTHVMALAVVKLPKSKRLSEPARRLLEKALTAMVRYPETVDMSTWYEHDSSVKPTPKRPKPYCGTVACLAGHVVIAGKLRRRVPYFSHMEAAGNALGLDDGTRNDLFMDYNTATGDRYPVTPRARVRAVVARVKHWIATGK